jgi:HEAT repeat protein
MAKRLSLDEKLAVIRRLRGLSPSPETIGQLRSALRDKSNLVVSAAAVIVGEHRLVDLAAELEAAFERFMTDPDKTDKLCRAKIAVAETLVNLEHDRSEVFVRAVRHVQFEPVWCGQEDTAGPLRAAAIVALARIGYHALLPLLVDALVDPKKEVRITAAQTLGDHGTEAATLLLRLKTRTGDKESDVISECLLGLLNAAPRENLALAAEFLDSADDAVREAAMMALGRSRLPEAFDLLRSFDEKQLIGSNDTIYMAMAMLRLSIANDFLLETVAAGPENKASSALAALWIYRYDPNLKERIAQAVRKNASPTLRARLELDAEDAR